MSGDSEISELPPTDPETVLLPGTSYTFTTTDGVVITFDPQRLDPSVFTQASTTPTVPPPIVMPPQPSAVNTNRSVMRIIHPRIGEEFLKLVEKYANRDPNAIIQVVIPFLIETSMQAYFDNLLMVHVPEEKQISRLMKRDNITKEIVKTLKNIK